MVNLESSIHDHEYFLLAEVAKITLLITYYLSKRSRNLKYKEKSHGFTGAILTRDYENVPRL